MQPNNSYVQNSTTPYQPQMVAPQLTPTPQSVPVPTKKSKATLIIILLLIAIIVGLVAFIVLDKFVFNKKEEDITETTKIYTTTPLSTALNNIDKNSTTYSTDITAILSGRIFTVDENFYEYIRFEDDHYIMSYYRNPSTERLTVLPSTSSGTYSVKDSIITLSEGDTFTITGDYLVKTADKLTTNINTVYFDSAQLPTFINKYSSALLSRANTWRKSYEDAPAIIKSNIVSFSCTTSSKKLTSADAFDCNTNYELFYKADKIKTYIVENKINKSTEENIKATFEDVVKYKNSPYAYLAKNVILYHDTSFVANANFVIRINDNTYTISGDYVTE